MHGRSRAAKKGGRGVLGSGVEFVAALEADLQKSEVDEAFEAVLGGGARVAAEGGLDVLLAHLAVGLDVEKHGPEGRGERLAAGVVDDVGVHGALAVEVGQGRADHLVPDLAALLEAVEVVPDAARRDAAGAHQGAETDAGAFVDELQQVFLSWMHGRTGRLLRDRAR